MRARRRRGVPLAGRARRNVTGAPPGGAGRTADAIDRLRPGDVVAVRRGGGRAVVLKPRERPGGRPPDDARDQPRDLPPRVPATSDAPPGRPPTSISPSRSRRGTRRSAGPPPRPCASPGCAIRPSATPRTPARPPRRCAAIPVASCPRLAKHLKASAAAERLGRETERPRRRGAGRSREPRPAVRPGAAGARSLGLRRRAGRSPRPARSSPASTPSPTSCRRGTAEPGCSTV